MSVDPLTHLAVQPDFRTPLQIEVPGAFELPLAFVGGVAIRSEGKRYSELVSVGTDLDPATAIPDGAAAADGRGDRGIRIDREHERTALLSVVAGPSDMVGAENTITGTVQFLSELGCSRAVSFGGVSAVGAKPVELRKLMHRRQPFKVALTKRDISESRGSEGEQQARGNKCFHGVRHP